jgi:protein associated with RNAse G/E
VAAAAIEVRVYKPNGVLHRRWHAELVEQNGALLVLDARFAETIVHDLLGTIPSGTPSTEYYWLDRWYNVFRFAELDGTLRNFYCNVNRPPGFDGKTLSYVDLDLDILVAPDYSYTVLDEADFEKSVREFGYDDELKASAHQALAELIRMIETRHFPFDEQIRRRQLEA